MFDFYYMRFVFSRSVNFLVYPKSINYYLDSGQPEKKVTNSKNMNNIYLK